MKQKELVYELKNIYEFRQRNLISDYEFITERGRIRQICHKAGIKFPEVDRKAKKAV